MEYWSLEQAKLAVKEAEINLGYTVIKAPIDGVVVDRRVNVGQTVVAGLNAPSLFLPLPRSNSRSSVAPLSIRSCGVRVRRTSVTGANAAVPATRLSAAIRRSAK